MALNLLPPELLEPIIEYTVPDGIESLALSCKAIYALCGPSVARHHEHRSESRNFTFRPPTFPSSAYHWIAHFAAHPAQAHYIRKANLWHAGRGLIPRIEPEERAAVAKLVSQFVGAVEDTLRGRLERMEVFWDI